MAPAWGLLLLALVPALAQDCGEDGTCPAGTPVSTEALAKAKGLVKDLVAAKSCGPILVRLAWHDAGTYDNTRSGLPWPEAGGAIGSIRTDHEMTAGPNAGLKSAEALLTPIKEQVPSLSWADLIQLASATAIEVMGGPVIPMRYGRVDGVPKKPTPPPFGLPDAKPEEPSVHLRAVFYKYGMDDKDIVALSGAHTVGRAYKERSGAVAEGYDGGTEYTKAGCPFLKGSATAGGRSWTKEWLKFDNSYFSEMGNGDSETITFPTDAVLRTDPAFKPHFEAFAASQEAFFEAYKVSHRKLADLGAKFSPPGGLEFA